MDPKLDPKLDQMRHSAAHLLAHAIALLYPETKFTIGPATDNGFFYDFLPLVNLKEEDLAAIEHEMHEIVQRKLPITQRLVDKDEARMLFKNNPFKLELIDQIPDEQVGISQQGTFLDLCKGGHVASTGDIKYFKLTNISGSYWRGDRENQALQRISGVAFLTQEAFEHFEKQQAEALLYDHRKLGKEMDLFSLQPEGPGFPFFHPKGMVIMNQLKKFMSGLLEEHGYQEISTPTILNEELWVQSGHATFYRDNMYFIQIDSVGYAVKPMSCPGAFLIYGSRPRSYRELPLRFSEFGHVHRRELSGVLHGLLRVRAFTQDDAHIMCTFDQLESEITTVLGLVGAMLKKVGFEQPTIYLATRPENAMGNVVVWDRAIAILEQALTKAGLDFITKPGEGAFYGPKIEFGIHDSMGRTWQCGTIQVDFLQPENFDLSYITPEGNRERVVVVHHAIYGSFERFFAVLLEHYKGRLPFWLAPEQCRILTICPEVAEYAKTISASLKKIGIRTELDASDEQLSSKIKDAQLERIPWMVILGKKEAEQQTLTIRLPDGKQRMGLTLAQVLEEAQALNT
jgi:threonyl-tRNA synthetase